MLRGLWKYALTICLILGTGFESLAASPAEEVELARYQLPLEVGSGITWKYCGTWNGYYYPFSDTIVLCKENLGQGVGVARFIYLHELGHSFTMRNFTDFSRWNGNYEDAADEWAAVFSVVQGHPEDLLKMATAFEEWDKENTYREGDEHSPMQVRATRLRSLYYGWKNPSGTFGDDWRFTLAFWKRELLRVGVPDGNR